MLKNLYWLPLLAVAIGLIARADRSRAADPPAAPTKAAESAKPPAKKPNVPTPTMGGKQWWTDELLFDDWRIQRNVLTGSCRVLDDADVRQAWGTLDDCKTKFEQLKAQRKLPAMKGKVVILLHGLGRSRTATQSMAKCVAQGNFTPLQFGYASTKEKVADHGKSLGHVIESLPPEVDEIDFVCHSLGNLVVRSYLADATDAEHNRHPDARIKRIVMLGPPNNGAKLAQILAENKLAQVVAGPPVNEMGPGFAELQKHLATPECEFGIIAGGRDDEKARNPLLKGGDDMVVAVAETKLPGATDFVVLPVVHTFMMDEPKVQEATLRFLLHGHFVSAEKRQPLPKEEAKAEVKAAAK